jgi:hypothetical protein
VSLRGYGGAEPTGAAFFKQIGLEPDSGFPTSPSDSAWKAASVELVEVAMEDLRDYPEPTEEFVARVNSGLLRAAKWLLSRPVEAFEQWRSNGRQADIFIGGWLEGDQFDLALPATFLLACGRAGLSIEICTND